MMSRQTRLTWRIRWFEVRCRIRLIPLPLGRSIAWLVRKRLLSHHALDPLIAYETRRQKRMNRHIDRIAVELGYSPKVWRSWKGKP
jgi:hypothetical protein